MKYTIEDLQPKARQVLEANEAGDPRATVLFMTLAFQLELPLHRVREGIEMLAEGVMPS